MYHLPRMCRTCLQMSRGDFKFVSLDSVDPLWESNSPNLKEQLISLVPEMKVESTGAYICTSCFIALRTAYEFKRMCQATEQKFQNHSLKYRRPFGMGPGSAQFHVTLNENCKKNPQEEKGACQNINYLQTDTSIDITEHHLYDARILPRKPFTLYKASDANTKPRENKKKMDSDALREKYKIGSEISILKAGKSLSTEEIIKNACEEVDFLKEKSIKPEDLVCSIRLILLTQQFVQDNSGKPFEELKELSQGYYFDELDEELVCQICTKQFKSRNALIEHEEQHPGNKYFSCRHCEMQFVVKINLEEHLKGQHAELESKALEEEKKVEPPDPEIKKEESEADANSEAATKKPEVTTSEPLTEEKIPETVKPDPTKAENEEEDLDMDISLITPSITLTEEDKPIQVKRKLPKIMKKLVKKYKNLQQKPFCKKYYKCFICTKVCESKLQFKQHINFTHVPSTSSAYWANFITGSKLVEDIPEELKVTTRSSNRIVYTTIYKCNICDKNFTDENFRSLHMYVHIPVIFSHESINSVGTDDGPEIFICYLCNKGFSKERYLKLHNLHVHQIKTITCKICRRDFKSEFWYDKHKCQTTYPILPDISDDGKKSYQCNFCNRTFAAIRFMKSHRKRMHFDLINRGPTRPKPKFLPNENDTVLQGLEVDDPMKLFSITGSSQYEDEEDVIEILSDSEGYSGEESDGDRQNEMEQEADQHDSVTQESKPFATSENDVFYSSRRKHVIPKIQCDFCGELIDENRYDKHIYEHNKLRLQKSKKSDSGSDISSESDKNKFILKCHICFRGFQRRYHLVNHINRHLNGELPGSAVNPLEMDENEVPAPVFEEVEEPVVTEPPPVLTDSVPIEDGQLQYSMNRANTEDVYECCGRSFKMKAHLFRHFTIKHKYSLSLKQKAASEKHHTPAPPVEPEELGFHFLGNHFMGDSSVQLVEDCPNQGYGFENDLKENYEDSPYSNKRKSESYEEYQDEAVTIFKKPKADVLTSMPPQFVFDDQDLLNSSQNQQILKYECPVCEKRFKQKCQLRDHSNVHTGAKPYVCDFCTPARGFTQTSSLYVHYRRVHVSIMKHCQWEVYSKNGSCLICEEVFDKHSVMFQHMKDYYIRKPFKCHACMDSFSLLCHFKVHKIDPEEMRAVVTPKEPIAENNAEDDVTLVNEKDDSELTMPTLERNSPTLTVEEIIAEPDIILHQSFPSKNQPTCEICNKTFSDNHHMNMHKKSLAHIQRANLKKQKEKAKSSENENVFVAIAAQVSSTKELTIKNVSNHMTMTDEERDLKYKRHKCLICGMRFTKKILLRKHKRKGHRNELTKKELKKIQKANARKLFLEQGGIVRRLTNDKITSEHIDEAIERVATHCTNEEKLKKNPEENQTEIIAMTLQEEENRTEIIAVTIQEEVDEDRSEEEMDEKEEDAEEMLIEPQIEIAEGEDSKNPDTNSEQDPQKMDDEDPQIAEDEDSKNPDTNSEQDPQKMDDEDPQKVDDEDSIENFENKHSTEDSQSAKEDSEELVENSQPTDIVMDSDTPGESLNSVMCSETDNLSSINSNEPSKDLSSQSDPLGENILADLGLSIPNDLEMEPNYSKEDSLDIGINFEQTSLDLDMINDSNFDNSASTFNLDKGPFSKNLDLENECLFDYSPSFSGISKESLETNCIEPLKTASGSSGSI